MPPKKDTQKRGRGKGSVSWLHQEMTALGMAALEASEKPDQKGAALEFGTAKYYPGCLRLVCEEEGGWVGSPANNYSMEHGRLDETPDSRWRALDPLEQRSLQGVHRQHNRPCLRQGAALSPCYVPQVEAVHGKESVVSS